MARIRKLVAALTRRGPHQVLRGDLAFAGLPGVVYTPEAGLNLPGVAFGHDWLTGTARYSGLLEHLASWGIVAGAPDTERGVAPSVLNLAFDLGTALDIVSGVRLGPGKISVHPAKLGVVGHGFGGSAAVFAAAGMPGQAGIRGRAVSDGQQSPGRAARRDAEGAGTDPHRARGSEDVELQRPDACRRVEDGDAAHRQQSPTRRPGRGPASHPGVRAAAARTAARSDRSGRC